MLRSLRRRLALRRFVCVRQADQSDCGPAALATVALHHGRAVRIERLREVAGTDRVGTSLLGLARAAEALGFATRAARGGLDGLAAVPLPAILHIHNADKLPHFIVLHRLDAASAVVADPARGVEELPREALAACWTGYVLSLVPVRLDGAHLGEVVAPWRRLVALVAARRRLLAEGYLCALLITALGVVSSLFVQHTVDAVFARDDASLLRAFAVGMLVTLGLRILFGAVRQYLMAWLGRQVELSLVSTWARHVLRLPMRFFEARQVGEVVSRAQDAAKVRDAVHGVAVSAVVDATVLLVSLAALWAQDRSAASIAAASGVALLVAVVAHQPAAREGSRRVMESAARLSSRLIEDVGSVETIKHLGVERRQSDRTDDALAATAQSAFRLQTLAVSAQSVATAVTGAATVAMFWHGGERVLRGEMSVGQLLFAQGLLGYILQPLERLAAVNLQLQDALVAVDRLHQVLDLEAESEGPPGAPLAPLRSGIELRGVTFRYGSRAPVLREVNLTLPAGATVAIVGESGSGKSTLLKLLQRFHDPSEGQVLVDGVDLRDLGLARWRAAVGVVPQEPTVFSGTLRENLLVAAPDASQEALLRAVRAAGLESTVERLPGRWEAPLGERGANLSGGQRQRIAIARALLRDPQLLLFDEATSHLDTATEQAIQQSLRSSLAGRTAVLVAHRLSTVRDADLIVVMHEGRVVEQGTHASLLAAHGPYARLWQAQSGAARSAFRHAPAAPERYDFGETLVDVRRAYGVREVG